MQKQNIQKLQELTTLVATKSLENQKNYFIIFSVQSDKMSLAICENKIDSDKTIFMESVYFGGYFFSQEKYDQFLKASKNALNNL